LKAAREAGLVHIVADEACLQELRDVLGYSEFGLADAQREHCLAEVERCIFRHEATHAASGASLPRCIDPDDQKFLALAHDASADWLLTRDKALLNLSRRLLASGIRVGSPAQWSAAFRPAH
jgi:predicted nucleic acid-binding protein